MHRLRLSLGIVLALFACGNGGCAGCGGVQQLRQGTYTGPKQDSAGAVRVSQAGYAYLNSDAGTSAVLSLFAPGGTLRVPVSCTMQTTSLAGIPILQLAVGDEGSLLCTSESCGQMDGRCDMNDVPRDVVINISSLRFAPKSPDLVEATIAATLQTGQLHIASSSGSACLLAGGGRIKCSIDFDTSRNPPAETNLGLNIKLVIDTRWDKLISLEIQDVDGAQACSGGAMAPACIDPRDIIMARPPGASCTLCTLGQLDSVKNLLIGQLTNSLRRQLNETLTEANCLSCEQGQCPMSPMMGVTARCEPEDGGPGTCIDVDTNKCVPGLIGLEGRADVATALSGLVPRGSELEFAFGAGGLSASSPAGTTIGLRGGMREVAPSSCVAPRAPPAQVMLPLPDFDRDAPTGGYDFAFSLSRQLLVDALHRVQQSGALCIELGQDSVAQLQSSALAAVLPSLNTLTEGQNVPLRLAVRPVNAPTVAVGEGTFTASGELLNPLLTLEWPGLELDLFALIEDRYVRLFTLSLDLALPFGLDVDGCDQLRPVIGNIMTAVRNVSVKNNDLVAERPDALVALVPTLLSAAEPQLARGLPTFTLPDVPQLAFRFQLVQARGVGQVAGSSTFNHLGIYARMYPRGEACPVPFKPEEAALWLTSREDATVRLTGLGTQAYSFRVDQGFWSVWRQPDAFGQAVVEHPRLRLGGPHLVEVRGQDGRMGFLEL